MKNDDKEVEIISTGSGYHLKPSNSEYQFFHSVKVPRKLWDRYVKRRTDFIDAAQQIRTYYKPPKDKPMAVAKNHVVREGEIIKFP